jgi:hypothetical protein
MGRKGTNVVNQVSLDEFVPSRYQMTARMVTTVIGDNVICGADSKRVMLKISPIQPFAVLNPVFSFNGVDDTCFRMAFNPNGTLSLNWFDDLILVNQQLFFRSIAGGEQFSVALFTNTVASQQGESDAVASIATIYSKIKAIRNIGSRGSNNARNSIYDSRKRKAMWHYNMGRRNG